MKIKTLRKYIRKSLLYFLNQDRMMKGWKCHAYVSPLRRYHSVGWIRRKDDMLMRLLGIFIVKFKAKFWVVSYDRNFYLFRFHVLFWRFWSNKRVPISLFWLVIYESISIAMLNFGLFIYKRSWQLLSFRRYSF